MSRRDGRNEAELGGNHGKKKRGSPKFASITDIPNAMEAQRSETPYLGSLDREEPEQKMQSTHQLLMMTASSITPLSKDNSDNDS